MHKSDISEHCHENIRKILNRHCRDPISVSKQEGKDKNETVVSSNGWWKKNALKNNAVLKVPGWIKSIRVLSGLMGQKSDEAFNYSNEFELRKNDKKLVLYSRNNNDDRTKNGEDLCKAVSDGQPAWVTIANENYAGSDEGQELSGKSVSAYTRQTSVYGVFTGE